MSSHWILLSVVFLVVLLLDFWHQNVKQYNFIAVFVLPTLSMTSKENGPRGNKANNKYE